MRVDTYTCSQPNRLQLCVCVITKLELSTQNNNLSPRVKVEFSRFYSKQKSGEAGRHPSVTRDIVDVSRIGNRIEPRDHVPKYRRLVVPDRKYDAGEK